MNDVIETTVNVINESLKVMKRPEVQSALGGLFKWISQRIFSNNKSAKEKLEQIQKNEEAQVAIAQLKTLLEYELARNEQLQDELRQQTESIMDVLKSSHESSTTTVTESTQTIVQKNVYVGGSIKNYQSKR